GWGLAGGVVLGLAISVGSTVVLLRTLAERSDLDSPQGRLAVGWLIVEDLFTVVVLVLLPTLAPLVGGTTTEAAAAGPLGSLGLGPIGELLLALGKIVLFGVLMVVVGMRVVPALLTVVARERSRELFTLAVLAVALGIAYVAFAVFGVSFALGAFLAGVVVSESDMSHQAAADALPLRDAFAVLFFVSIGMLVDPAFLLANPLAILAVAAIVIVAKPVAVFSLVALAGYPSRVALTVAAGLAQIGEFSFILATLGIALGLLPRDGLQLVVAGSILSITVNPLLLGAVEPIARRIATSARLARRMERRVASQEPLPMAPGREPTRGHAIICGYGRVGRLIASALDRRGFPYFVITDDRREVDRLRDAGVPALYGDAANAAILEHAHVATARVIVVATREPHAARLIAEGARAINPRVPLVVRTHSEREASYLRASGEGIQPIHGELELAVQMSRYTLRRFGVSSAEDELIAQGLRDRGGRRAPPIDLRPNRPADG
ncbi:MAG: cation:proton antiporter, partial [Chloroflexi bacterium]|nr:cation:proton antiporter [Chloroflexota bacterium]